MKKRSIRGGIIILTAVLFPVFIAFMVLVLDTWNLYLVYNEMSAATDAAALAGATSLRSIDPGETEKATSLALSIAGVNKFRNGINNTTVTVSIPPGDPFGKSPSYATNDDFVRVQISHVVSLYLGSFFNFSGITLQTNSVAGPANYYPVVIALSRSGQGSLQLSGGTTLDAPNGIIGVNSNHSTAVSVSNNSTINSSLLNIVGGYGSGGTITGQINTHTDPTKDPFSSLSLPTPPFNCNYSNISITKNNTVTLNPGVYCGGIKISGNGTIQFTPGTYILNGGGFTVSGNSHITGNEVTFYNTGTSSGSTKYGDLSIAGGGSISLSAPASGPYAGMLFIQDPLNKNDVKITGSSSQNYMGNIYAPSSNLTITGKDKLARPLGVCVTDTITLKGGGEISFTPNYTSMSGTGKIALFE